MKLWPWLLLLAACIAACTVADAAVPVPHDSTADAMACGADLAVSPQELSVLPTGGTGPLSSLLVSPCGFAMTTDSAVVWLSRDTVIATVVATSATAALVTGHDSGSTYVVATLLGHQDSSLITVTSDTTPATPADTVSCAGADVSLAPGDSVADSVAAHAAGTSFCLAPGTYRAQNITLKADDQLIGSGSSTILTGGRVLSSWTSSGSTWYATGQTQGGTPAAGTASTICKPTNIRCLYAEDVFLDNVIQTHVTSLAAVSAGKWFFDYAADRIYIGSNPSGHTVETSVTPKAVGGSASRVILRNFVVEKYAAPYNGGAVSLAGAASCTVDGLEGRYNHSAAVDAGPSCRVTNGYFHHNGQYGLTGHVANMLFQGNEVAYNNTAGFSQSWAAGGAKFALTTGLIVRGNFFHHNYGHAIWVDIGNYQALIEDNAVEDNYGRGVFYEISYDAVIRNNTFARNGRQAPTLLRGGCIGVVSSPNVEVYGNACDGDKDGITGVQDARGSGPRGTYELVNLYVHDNTLSNITAYAAGIVQTVSNPAYYTSKNNRWVANTYSGLAASPFYWQNAARNLAAWNGYGQQ